MCVCVLGWYPRTQNNKKKKNRIAFMLWGKVYGKTQIGTSNLETFVKCNLVRLPVNGFLAFCCLDYLGASRSWKICHVGANMTTVKSTDELILAQDLSHILPMLVITGY